MLGIFQHTRHEQHLTHEPVRQATIATWQAACSICFANGLLNLMNLMVLTAGWLLGWWVFGRPRSVGDLPEPTGSDRPVSIVIPARNEATSLPLLLSDLVAGRPVGSEVLVVDDHSTDSTAEIAQSFDFVTVVPAPELPSGWAGKSWACATGAAASHAELLVFLDADVRVEPGALDQLLEERERSGGLVSVQPWHVTKRPYEQLSALFNVIAIMGIGAGSGLPPSGAFGPVMVCSRPDYLSAGGHEAVRSEVVEDIALANCFANAGIPVSVHTGYPSIRFRMYPAGIQSLIDGWTKNFVTGAGATSPLRLAAIALWVTALGAFIGLATDCLSGGVPIAAGPLFYVAFVVQLRAMFRKTGTFGTPTAMLFPLLMVFFVAVFIRSAWRTYVRRSVNWRGRSIPIGSQRP